MHSNWCPANEHYVEAIDVVLFRMYAVNYSFYGYLLATDRLRKVFIQSDNDIDLNNLKYIDEVCESIHDVLRLDRERLNTFEHFCSARSFIHVIFAQYQGKDPL